MIDDVREFLVSAGVSEDDMRRAEEEGWLLLLVLDRFLLPGHPRGIGPVEILALETEDRAGNVVG